MSSEYSDKSEQIAEMASWLATVRRIEHQSRSIGLAVMVVTGIPIATFILRFDNPLMLAGFAVAAWCAIGYFAARLSRQIMYRAEGKQVPLLEWTEDERNQKPAGVASSYAVRRLQGMVAPDADAIADAPLLEDMPVISCVGGPAQLVDAGKREAGVCVFTTAGIAFLPDANPNELGPAATVAAQLLKDRLPLVDIFLKAGVETTVAAETPVAGWLAKARTYPNYFAIPWPQVVEAAYQPLGGRTTIVREQDDGSRQSFVLLYDDDRLPAGLFNQRLHFETHAIFDTHFLVPKVREIAPSLTAKFRSIYGDRLEDHLPEIRSEAMDAAFEALAGSGAVEMIDGKYMNVPGAAARYMLDVAEQYRRVLPIVEGNHWFFTAADRAVKGS